MEKNTEKERYIIAAPHADDELIGCWSVFRKYQNLAGRPHAPFITVLYFDPMELQPERKVEANNFACETGFQAYFNSTSEDFAKVVNKAERDYKWVNVLIPARTDHHPEHKAMNASLRKYATDFYSVDMGSAKPLSTQDAAYKRQVLNRYYPSQIPLWERDHKYWLFEDIQPTDYLTYTTVCYQQIENHIFTGTPGCEVRVLQQYESRVRELLDDFLKGYNTRMKDPLYVNQLFNLILGICVEGEVELRADKMILSTR